VRNLLCLAIAVCFWGITISFLCKWYDSDNLEADIHDLDGECEAEFEPRPNPWF
jgi:hypothetical protein